MQACFSRLVLTQLFSKKNVFFSKKKYQDWTRGTIPFENIISEISPFICIYIQGICSIWSASVRQMYDCQCHRLTNVRGLSHSRSHALVRGPTTTLGDPSPFATVRCWPLAILTGPIASVRNPLTVSFTADFVGIRNPCPSRTALHWFHKDHRGPSRPCATFRVFGAFRGHSQLFVVFRIHRSPIFADRRGLSWPNTVRTRPCTVSNGSLRTIVPSFGSFRPVTVVSGPLTINTSLHGDSQPFAATCGPSR